MEVVNGEKIGSEVKYHALFLLANLAFEAANRARMYSDCLIVVSMSDLTKMRK